MFSKSLLGVSGVWIFLAQVHLNLKTRVHLCVLLDVEVFVNGLMGQDRHFGLMLEVSACRSRFQLTHMIQQHANLESSWFSYYAKWKRCRMKQV